MEMNVVKRPFRWITYGYLIYILMALVVFPAAPACLWAAEKKIEPFDHLRRNLARDGFDQRQLNHYYGRPGVAFEEETVSRYFQHQEATLNYDQFLTWTSLRKARHYLKEQRQWLDQAAAEYQVAGEIITAILLVETKLGTYTGRASTFNVLSSMAALADADVRDRLWQSLSANSQMTREDYLKKAARKSQWAYSELTAFLTYLEREHIADPMTIRGSYAGAVGISQFMPSNILKLGVDGDRDGRIDLFTHADAILSVANYLRHHGWKSGLSDAQARKVLFAYNHSTYYVDILMRVLDRLREDS